MAVVQEVSTQDVNTRTVYYLVCGLGMDGASPSPPTPPARP